MSRGFLSRIKQPLTEQKQQAPRVAVAIRKHFIAETGIYRRSKLNFEKTTSRISRVFSILLKLPMISDLSQA